MMSTNGVYGPDAAKHLADQLRELAARIEREATNPNTDIQTINYEMKRAHSKRYDRTGMMAGADVTRESIEIHISFHLPLAYSRG
jgi:hypothetical protein